MLLGQTPDDLLRLKLTQALDGKNQVDVTKRIGLVVRLMRDREVGCLCVFWNRTICRVAIEIKWAIALHMNPTSRDQHDRALGERFTERRPWNFSGYKLFELRQCDRLTDPAAKCRTYGNKSQKHRTVAEPLRKEFSQPAVMRQHPAMSVGTNLAPCHRRRLHLLLL